MQNKSSFTGRLDVKAFTLIELLVVMLIIGILAAVALPQYQKAVEKSRLTTLIPLVKSVTNAKIAHQLATGEYARTFDVLAVELPPKFVISDSTYYGQSAYWNQRDMAVALDAGDHSVAGTLGFRDHSTIWFYIKLNNSQTCLANGGVGTRADRLCKSLPGAIYKGLSNGTDPWYEIHY